uniref:Uncharacterized protein n=1 Tax=Magnusiomyces tetraspermus TaxID=1232584 RepID=A0A023UP77_9ASCO|nr:hypothetical protein [Magnusiomyces tetraspermus]AHY04951.1 hypothetical protein [Magnusiomyces tetraspermus]
MSTGREWTKMTDPTRTTPFAGDLFKGQRPRTLVLKDPSWNLLRPEPTERKGRTSSPEVMTEPKPFTRQRETPPRDFIKRTHPAAEKPQHKPGAEYKIDSTTPTK